MNETEKKAEILAQEIYETLLDSCGVLRKKLPVSKRVIKSMSQSLFYGDDEVVYGRLLEEFNAGLSRIEYLLKEGTVLELFRELNDFYTIFYRMKDVHWESDVKFKGDLTKAVYDFSNASSKVIGFLRECKKNEN